MTDQDNEFFVGLKDPKVLRKQLLLTTKEVLIGLRKFEHFASKRMQRIELVIHLQKNLKELNFLMNKLKAALPKNKLKGAPQEKPKPMVPTEKPGKKTAPKAKPHKPSHIDKLELELEAIESKLSKFA